MVVDVDVDLDENSNEGKRNGSRSVRQLSEERDTYCVLRRWHLLGVTAIACTLLAACKADVGGESCETESDCFVGERCEFGLCVSHHNANDGSDLVDGDTARDDPSETDQGDTVEDALDVADGSDDSDEDIDGCDDSDEDIADSTDDALDNDHDTDHDSDDGGTDSGPAEIEPCSAGLYHHLDVSFYEPCRDPSPGASDDCEPAEPAYGENCSTWPRTDEPVEIPLRNGIIDESVPTCFPFDADETGERLANTGGRSGEMATWASPDWGDSVTSTLGNAAVFNGTFPIEVTPFPLALAEEWTIAFYFLVNDPSETEEILLAASNDEGFDLQIATHDQMMAIQIEWSESTGYMLSPEPLLGTDPALEPSGRWHHLMLTKPRANAPILFVDGVLVGGLEMLGEDIPGAMPADATVTLGGQLLSIGLSGRLDEVLFFTRAVTSDELQVYLDSRAPFGALLLPGAQPDFDDVRVTRCEVDSATCEGEEYLDHEIIGVRPFSDQADAFFVLDADEPETPGSTACGLENSSISFPDGRFGYENDQSVGFYNAEAWCDTYVMSSFDSSFTIEAWILAGAKGRIFGFDGKTDTDRLFVELSEGGVVSLTIGDQYLSGPTIQHGTWFHLALVRDENTATVQLFHNGLATSEAREVRTGRLNRADGPLSIYLGAVNEWGVGPSAGFSGEVDDFVVHHRALSVEEVRRRALPTVPTVRFLVSTADGDGVVPCEANPVATHRLYWGDPVALYAPPPECSGGCQRACMGLLSSCRGYAGWWRFDRGFGHVAIDSSAHNRHLGLPEMGTTWIESWEGAALGFDGTGVATFYDGHTGILPALLAGSVISIEATVGLTVESIARNVVGLEDAAGCRTFDLWYGANSLGLSFDPDIDQCSTNAHNFQTTGPPVDTSKRQAISVTYSHGLLTLPDMYVDHVETAPPAGSVTDALPVSGRALSVGGLASGGSLFTGLIDSVRILTVEAGAEDGLHFPLLDNTAWSQAPDDAACSSLPPETD